MSAFTLRTVEEHIILMDTKYDANFGEWVHNCSNARIIGQSLQKYLDIYPSEKFMVVIEWIIGDWSLKSRIIFLKNLLCEMIVKNNSLLLFNVIKDYGTNAVVEVFYAFYIEVEKNNKVK